MVYKKAEYIEIVTIVTGGTAALLSPAPDGIKEAWINSEANGPCTLEFELPLTSPKWAYLNDKHKIIAGGKEFVIANPDAIDKKRDGQKKKGKVKAHESWTLLGKKYATISNDPQTPNPPWSAVVILSGGSDLSGARHDVGSAGHALYTLLQGTGWTVGTVDVDGLYDLETEKESILANINKVQETWGGILVWDSINKTVSLRDETLWQNYTGYQIRYAKNLKGITRTDDYDIVTRLYPFGENDLNIANVNGGLLYLNNNSYTMEVYEGIWVDQNIHDQQELKTAGERQLAKMCRPRHNYKTDVLDLRTLPEYAHETFDFGDMVDVVDEDLGIDDRARIIGYRYNIFQPWLCSLEVGDPIVKIAASVAQSIAMARVLKVVYPNTSFQNLIKGIINTVATEINGANGDYTLKDGVSTWLERDENGNVTGNLVRITPQGFIISSDGGQNWDLAINGAGINASAVRTGTLQAGVVTIGPETTFAPGYDPSQIEGGETVGMGVDSDCVGLWHFDGSLNSHKGTPAIFDGVFEAGVFGQAAKVATGKTLKVPTTGMSANQSTINLRAKNLAASANGSVLVDLPDSVGTAGLKVGIASDGKIFAESIKPGQDEPVDFILEETTRSDFETGVLSNVWAKEGGLQLDTTTIRTWNDFTGTSWEVLA